MVYQRVDGGVVVLLVFKEIGDYQYIFTNPTSEEILVYMNIECIHCRKGDIPSAIMGKGAVDERVQRLRNIDQMMGVITVFSPSP